jgi:hypothetical protein
VIFTQQLQRVDSENPREAIKKMANYINYMREQLEYTLLNLDSSNVTEIDTSKTVFTSSGGSVNLGDYVSLEGENGESFKVGRNKNGGFDFSVTGKGGTQTLYLDSSGNLIITKHTSITVDGGEW